MSLKEKGFSLIEILVAIVVLMAILMPVMNAINTNKSNSSTMQKLATAASIADVVMQYLLDNVSFADLQDGMNLENILKHSFSNVSGNSVILNSQRYDIVLQVKNIGSDSIKWHYILSPLIIPEGTEYTSGKNRINVLLSNTNRWNRTVKSIKFTELLDNPSVNYVKELKLIVKFKFKGQERKYWLWSIATNI